MGRLSPQLHFVTLTQQLGKAFSSCTEGFLRAANGHGETMRGEVGWGDPPNVFQGCKHPREWSLGDYFEQRGVLAFFNHIEHFKRWRSLSEGRLVLVFDANEAAHVAAHGADV